MPTHKKIHSYKPLQATLKPKLAREYFFLPPKKNFFPPFLFLIKLFRQRTGLVVIRTDGSTSIDHFADNFWLISDTYNFGQKRRASANMGLASCGVTCLNTSVVFQINFSAGLTVLCSEIPHERHAQKRCA